MEERQKVIDWLNTIDQATLEEWVAYMVDDLSKHELVCLLLYIDYSDVLDAYRSRPLED